MKEKNTRIILLIIIFLLGAVAPAFLWKAGNIFAYIIRPLIWISLFFLTRLFIGKGNKPFSFKKKDTREYAIIGSLIFIIVYYSLGLVIGYARTPYQRDLLNIVKNSWSILAFYVPRELIRYQFAKSANKRNVFKVMSFVTIVMILSDIPYSSYTLLSTNLANIIEYVIKTFLPAVGINAFLSYLSTKDGYLSALLYILPIKLVEIITPVFPNNVFFILIIVYTLVPLLTFVKIEDVHNRDRRFGIEMETSIRQKISRVVLSIVFVFLIAFTTRMLPIVPTVILSNSMNPSIKRGDMVVIKKITYENIKINDVIEYKLDKIYIVHRVINIKQTKNGNIYITKGDNNLVRDSKSVTEKQITGKVVGTIPSVGYPTIWVRDFIQNARGITIVEGVR